MNIGKPERETQNRVIALFHDELNYRYLGDRADRPGMTAQVAAFCSSVATRPAPSSRA